MNSLFFKYYLDTIKYNLLFCAAFSIISFTIISFNITGCLINFATAGTLVSFIVFRYFNNIEYTFYLNRGLTKIQLQVKTLAINILLVLLTLIILWVASFR
jgi:hypothetical protein